MALKQNTLPRMAWDIQQQQPAPSIPSGALRGKTPEILAPLTARSVTSSTSAWGTHVAAPSGMKMEFPMSARAGTPLGLRSATPDVARVASPLSPDMERASKCSIGGQVYGQSKISGTNVGKPHSNTKLKSLRKPRSSSRRQQKQSVSDVGTGMYEDLQKVSTLLQYLQVTGIKLLRGSYLCQLRDRGELLPRHQEIPANAFCTLEEIGVYARACGFEGKPLVVSHPWWSFQHPDPSGVKLQQICLFLETKLSPTTSAVTNRPVFIDYCSLPFPVVGDRLPDGTLELISRLGTNEEVRYKRALRNMHVCMRTITQLCCAWMARFLPRHLFVLHTTQGDGVHLNGESR
eukprot:gnl/MRDRNA2_/MRDRNA2_77661_c0_seq1.p1 gnl/MRDRNA2_/MRDRNA2_77661_c0~~gnl/MRDRNA2_/MRDRNA2_77661_c0_seq1.p1  ORF type:complete len:347 (-),score=34.71 gnl/MRDRNA2_/MRDRNA2_77661_c0_seq1:369-1409(-)